MTSRFILPTEEEERRIAEGIASDPDAAPDFGDGIPEGVRLIGRLKDLQLDSAYNFRLDADVLDHFRSTGPGWQTRINAALRKAAGL
jgi:uncharacterized protein (DUF4415 family)